MNTTTAPQIRNGVDLEALGQTVAVIGDQPEVAQFKFRARNQWENGSRNHTEVQDYYGAMEEQKTRAEPFKFTADEPPVLLGTDTGANPVEYLLTGLASCVTTSLAYHAAANGIDVDSISSELEGDLDLQGFLGMDPEVTPGFQEIRMNFEVKTEADEMKLKELMNLSPVLATVTRPVPVKITVNGR